MKLIEILSLVRAFGFGGALGAAAKLADSAERLAASVPPSITPEWEAFRKDLAEFRRLAFPRSRP